MRRARCSRLWSALALGVGTIVLLAACAPAARPAAPAAPAAPSAPSQPQAGAAPAGGAASAPVDPFVAAKTMSLDELHQKALAEGGVFSFYATIAAATAERLFPLFEQRF